MAEEVTPAQGETEPQVTSNDAGAGQGNQPDPKAEAEALVAAANKRAEQAEMRARQLENERKERERQEMEDQGKYKELLDDTRKELAEIKQQRETDEILEQFDPEVRKLAKKLFSTGELKDQLAALQEAVKQTNDSKASEEETTEEETPQPKTPVINPNPRSAAVTTPQQNETLEQMADRLEKATKGKGL